MPVSRQSAGDARIAVLRQELTAELATHEVEIGRLEGLIAAERSAMTAKRTMLDRLGPAPAPRKRKGSEQGALA
jgi:hypothetical protein